MLGGIAEGHRELFTPDEDPDYGAFEQTVDRVLGEHIRKDQESADEFWAALANVGWRGPGGLSVGYSFRAAGDLCAALRKDEGKMTYMRYYMNKPHGVVAEWIEERLAAEGWHPEYED